MADAVRRATSFYHGISTTASVPTPLEVQPGDWGLFLVQSSADLVTATYQRPTPETHTVLRALANSGSGAWGLYVKQYEEGDADFALTNADANNAPIAIAASWYHTSDGFGTLGAITARVSSVNLTNAAAHGTASDFTKSLVLITGKTYGTAPITIAATDGSGPAITAAVIDSFGSGAGHPYAAIFEYDGTAEAYRATTQGAGGTGTGVQIAVLNGEPPPPPEPTATNFWADWPTDLVEVSAKTANATTAALVVSVNSDLSSPITTGFDETPDARGQVRCSASGLSASTTYHYGLLLDETELVYGGHFKTPGATVEVGIFGSCQYTGSNHVTFDTMAAIDADWALHLGDRGYQDRNVNNAALYRDDWDAFFTPRVRNFLASTALAQIWDNHDFCGTGSHATSTGAAAVTTARRAVVPDGNLPASAIAEGGFWRAWVRPGVDTRVILLDGRSQRDDPEAANGPTKTMLGAVQKQWLKDTLTTATERLILIAMANTWTPGGDDRWSDYPDEFVEINEFMADLFGVTGDTINRVVILSGDQHAVAADDGSRFKPAGFTANPVNLVGAAFDQAGAGSGSWSEGNFPNESGRGQFGWIRLTAVGDTTTLEFEGRRDDGQVRTSWTGDFVAESSETPLPQVDRLVDGAWVRYEILGGCIDGETLTPVEIVPVG